MQFLVITRRGRGFSGRRSELAIFRMSSEYNMGETEGGVLQICTEALLIDATFSKVGCIQLSMKKISCLLTSANNCF